VTPPQLSPRVRWTIVGLLSSSIAINLIDRQVLSVLAPLLRESLNLTATQYAYIAASFQFGMMVGQVPMGAFIDRVGTRVDLASIFVAWSVIGGAHALAAGVVGFVVLRFLMGLAECGNYTAGVKAIAALFPSTYRSSAGGLFNAGAQLGSVIATPLVVLIATTLGWRMAFLLPAAVGLLWLIPWLTLFPEKQAVTAAASGRAAGPHVRLVDLIRNRKVMGLFLIRAFSGPITTFYWVWLPLYLRSERAMSYATIGMLGWLPNLVAWQETSPGGS